MRKSSKLLSLRVLFQLFSYLGGWRGFAAIISLTVIVLFALKREQETAVVKPATVRQLEGNEHDVHRNIPCEPYYVLNLESVTLDVVETMPEFPGGEIALMEFIAKHINPSLINKDKKISKIVFYRIAISKDGTIMQTELLRGCGDEYNKDALRVIQLMPRWIPGVQDHQKVNVFYTLPINYNQKKHEKKQ